MMLPCRRIAAWVEQDRAGRLDGSRRQRLAMHMEACPGCRLERAETDPLPLFEGLTLQPLPDGVEAFILGGLRAAQSQTDWRRWPQWVARGMETASAVAAILFLGLLLSFWIGRGGPQFGVGSGGVAGMEAQALRLPPHAMSNAVSTVQDIRSSTAEIYAFSLPGQTGTTEVIFIVDRSIDL